MNYLWSSAPHAVQYLRGVARGYLISVIELDRGAECVISSPNSPTHPSITTHTDVAAAQAYAEEQARSLQLVAA